MSKVVVIGAGPAGMMLAGMILSGSVPPPQPPKKPLPPPLPAWVLFGSYPVPLSLRQVELYREQKKILAMSSDERYQAAMAYCQDIHDRNPFIDEDTLVETVCKKFHL